MERAQQMPAAKGLDVRIDHEGGRMRLSVSGDLDIGHKERFEAGLKEAHKDGCNQIVIDLSGVTFIDSTGLGLLITAWNESKRRGLELEVMLGEATQVRRTLSLTGVDRFIPLVDASDGAAAVG
jgi:anti-sigma B factor antagonist